MTHRLTFLLGVSTLALSGGCSSPLHVGDNSPSDAGLDPADAWTTPMDGQAGDASAPPRIDGSAPRSTALAIVGEGFGATALDPTHLYWSIGHGVESKEGSVIQRIPRTGGSIETLAELPRWVSGLVVDEDAVFASTDGGLLERYAGVVYRIPKTGGKGEPVTTGRMLGKIVIDGDALYHENFVGEFTIEPMYPGVEFVYDFNVRELRRVHKSQLTSEPVFDHTFTGTFAVQDGWVYAAQGGAIVRARLDRDEQEILYENRVHIAYSIIRDEYVYFTACEVAHCPMTGLYRVPLDGGEAELLHEAILWSAKFAVAGDRILWGPYAFRIGEVPVEVQSFHWPRRAEIVEADADGGFLFETTSGEIYRAW